MEARPHLEVDRRAPRLVGRRRELDALLAALHEAGDPAPLMVVGGEAGIGKTLTVTELAAIAGRAGSSVLCGSCHGTPVRPHSAWTEALDGHLSRLPSDQVASVVGDDGGVLLPLAPSLRATLPDLATATAMAGEEGRARLYEAIVRLLARLPDPVVILDDVHWADSTALDLLDHVARFSPATPIVVTFRGVELDLDHELAQRLARIGRHRPTRFLTLGGLTRDDAHVLLARIAGERLPSSLVATIVEEADGNPFFLGELARHALERSPSERAEDRWTLPETVRGAVALRLAELGRETRRLLELASAFTSGFTFDQLRALMGLSEGQVLDLLDEALGADLLRAAGAERYDFAHALVRQTLYERFSPSRRARLHRRLAEALEAAPLPASPETAAEIACQYHASVTLPGAARGMGPALEAARHARAVHAPTEAVRLLVMALALDGEMASPLRGEVLGELAIAQSEAALLSEAPRTLTAALDALGTARARETATVVSQVVAALQDALADQQVLEPLIAHGLDALGSDRDLTWARLKLLQRPLEPIDAGPLDAARWLGFDGLAVEVARREGSEADYARTIDAYQAHSPSSLRELAGRVEAWHDPVARLRGLDVVVRGLTLDHGVTPDAAWLCDHYHALAHELGSLPSQALARIYQAAITGSSGRLDAATEHLAHARRLAQRFAPDGRVEGLATYTQALIEEHIDPDWAALAARSRRLAVERRRIGWLGLVWGAYAAHAYAHAGMKVQSRQMLDHVLPGLVAARPEDYGQNRAVFMAADAVWHLDASEFAADLLAPALRLVEHAVGDWCMTSNELAVARLLVVADDRERALQHFAGARERCAQRGRRPLAAIVDHDEAIARRRLGISGGTGLWDTAQEQFALLGMRARLADEPPGPANPPARPDGLTRREAEVLRLVATGRTNREIAEQLFLSIHTVERHLQNAYRKISARNRADATAYVLRRLS